MANVQDPAATPNPRRAGESSAASEARRGAETAEARTFDQAGAQVEEGARAAEAVSEKPAEASSAATKANAEILRVQIETAEQAVRSGFEAGARTVEVISRSFVNAWGVASPNPDLAEQSSQNVQAVSRASTVLVKGAQDAARTWFDLTQNSLRTNLEAVSEIAKCRSAQELVNAHSNLLWANLRNIIESGDAITRASADAIGEATRAMQSPMPQATQSPRP